MIFKTFKEKSNQKHIDKLLSARKAEVNDNKVKSIAILFNADEFDDFEVYRNYFETLNLLLNTPVIFVANDKLKSDKLEFHYDLNDFGWRGKLKNARLLDFCNTPFDVLISYYKKDVVQLNLITALSKANFKVGLSNNDERLYDLIINLDPNDISVFKKEFEKYLKILNKL